MRIPDSLAQLADEGIIDEVLRPLMSGKEAQLYLLSSGGEQRVAKVYKESQNRSFRQRAEYTEGRKVRNTRDQRAIANRTRHGREQDEAAWRASEVDTIYRLHAAGVRVPTPYQFIDGVLIMELITDGEGNPAPRLGDVSMDRERAVEVYDHLLREVVRMLCAGVVHGDLSDFNVLMSPEGPVIIDFPQAVNASSNANARKLLLRDVDNLHRFVARFVPERRALPYAEEMWALYQRGELTPDARLSGRYRAAESRVDTDSVLGLIADAERDERRRRSNLGLSMRGTEDQPNAPGGRPDHGRGPGRSGPPQRQRPALNEPARPLPSQPRRDSPRDPGRPQLPQKPQDPRFSTSHAGAQGAGSQQRRPDPRRRGPDPRDPRRPIAQPIVQSRRPTLPDPRQQPILQRSATVKLDVPSSAAPSASQKKRRRRRRKAKPDSSA